MVASSKENTLTMPLRTLQKSLAAVLPAVDRNSLSAGPGVVRVQRDSEDDERVEFAASDRKLTIRATYRVGDVGLVRPAYIPAARLESFARLLEGETVTLTAKGERKVMALRCGGTTTRFALASGDEFPFLAAMPTSRAVFISLATLAHMIRFAVFPSKLAASALLEVEGGMVHLCYTDGHRLARYSSPYPGNALRLVLPEALLTALAKIGPASAGQDGTCSVFADAESIAVRVVAVGAGTVWLGHRLTEGKFPNYRAILPTKAEGSVSVPTAALTAAVRRCAAFSSDAVSLTVSPREIRLRGVDAATGESEDTLLAASSFEFAPVEIQLSAAYLLDVLRRLEGDVTLSVARVGDQLGLWIVHEPAEFEHFEYVLMGIRKAR